MLGATDKGSYSLAADMGAATEVSFEKISIYLPDKDRAGNEVPNITVWINLGMAMMTTVNGGVTCLPSSIGMWKSSSEIIVTENTTVLYSFIRDRDQFEAEKSLFREFLHQFGRETNQEEVVFEYMGDTGSGLKSYFYAISDFDPPAA
jgi:hypothetical protein